jgi:hypothetical protein
VLFPSVGVLAVPTIFDFRVLFSVYPLQYGRKILRLAVFFFEDFFREDGDAS